MPKPQSTDISALGRAWAIGMDLVIYLIAGGLIGFGLDYLFKTGPLLMILIGLLGLASGLFRFVREALQLNRQMSGTVKDVPPLEEEEEKSNE